MDDRRDWDEDSDPEFEREIERIKLKQIEEMPRRFGAHSGQKLFNKFFKGILGTLDGKGGSALEPHCPYCKTEMFKPNDRCDRPFMHDRNLYNQKLKEWNQ